MLEDTCRYSKGSQSRVIRSGAKSPNNKCVISPQALSSSKQSVKEEGWPHVEFSITDEAAFGLPSIKRDLNKESEQTKRPSHAL